MGLHRLGSADLFVSFLNGGSPLVTVVWVKNRFFITTSSSANVSAVALAIASRPAAGTRVSDHLQVPTLSLRRKIYYYYIIFSIKSESPSSQTNHALYTCHSLLRSGLLTC